MREAPFARRAPVFLGDDVTDESVFAILDELGGMGFGVGRHFPRIAGVFPGPHEVRRAVAVLANSGAMPDGDK